MYDMVVGGGGLGAYKNGFHLPILLHMMLLSHFSTQLYPLTLLLNPRVNKMWFQGQPSHSQLWPMAVTSLTSGREMERPWLMVTSTVVPPLLLWPWWMLWRKMRETSHVWSLMFKVVVSPPVLQSWLSVSVCVCVCVCVCAYMYV